MDEAENCDRIAIMDHGKIVVLDTPEALKASIGKDRVQITTADDQAAIAELQEPVRHRRRGRPRAPGHVQRDGRRAVRAAAVRAS